jgi:hypothetical protein
VGEGNQKNQENQERKRENAAGEQDAVGNRIYF